MAGLLSAHFDLDAFYASVEEKHRGLSGVPLVVGGTDGRGGAVTSANRAARALGIRAGESIERIRRDHGARVLVCPVRMHLYQTESRAVMEVLRAAGAPMQQMSVDEACLDLRVIEDDLSGGWAGVRFCERLRRTVRSECGLAISVGVSRGRTTAKMAVEEAKPDGLRAIDADELETWLPAQPLHAIPGIGPVGTRHLATRDLRSVADARAAGERALRNILGEARGAWLWGVIEGHGDTPELDRALTSTRSMGAESTLSEVVHSLGEVDDLVAGLCADVCGRMLENAVYASGIRVLVRTAAGEHLGRQRRIEASRAYPAIRSTVGELLGEVWPARGGVRLVGLSTYDLSEHRALRLFEEEIELRGTQVGELWEHPILGEGLIVRRDGAMWTVAFPDRRRVIDTSHLRNTPR